MISPSLAAVSEPRPLLSVEKLEAGYGRVQILRGISLSIAAGTVTALVGPNGAGKTTLMKAIAGMIPARSGQIRFDGRDILAMPSYQRVESGIALVPEGRLIFARLSVEQNLRLGAVVPHARSKADQTLAEIYERFPRLAERRNQVAGSMSGGEQQMLALGRGLMSQPRLILLDEPTLGLAPIMVARVFEVIAELRQAGFTILLSEQNSHLALGACDYAYLIENGSIHLQGTGADLAGNDEVQRLYMGR
ncbi:ABC transporter ATP-binding protein [Paracoccus sp. IB05]|uniref:ABC transporter ATP-binding protein n=1 Tax=Paracoccus sp. IB05 TaxID=2779367 RepID=UPI0018E77252|nr:ABC transporter ATP-binding protein [Paracoccus sp. IB05]MBJ2151596.1 ABC transporter ATP-binding protein [Paracoccus sp. IB05]